MIVVTCLLIHPIVRIYYVSNLLYSYTSILGTIVLIPMFYMDYKYTALFEAFIMTILSLLVY